MYSWNQYIFNKLGSEAEAVLSYYKVILVQCRITVNLKPTVLNIWHRIGDPNGMPIHHREKKHSITHNKTFRHGFKQCNFYFSDIE